MRYEATESEWFHPLLYLGGPDSNQFPVPRATELGKWLSVVGVFNYKMKNALAHYTHSHFVVNTFLYKIKSCSLLYIISRNKWRGH